MNRTRDLRSFFDAGPLTLTPEDLLDGTGPGLRLIAIEGVLVERQVRLTLNPQGPAYDGDNAA